MNRGDVYEYTIGNARARVVVVSAEPYNPRRATFAVVLGRDVPPPPAAVLVGTGPADPVRGTIDTTRLRPLVADNVGARVGRMSRSTMERVNDALRTYLGL
jgi:mRNA-degrading endonuclease toxin of MazEF toxin-antitoxin module